MKMRVSGLILALAAIIFTAPRLRARQVAEPGDTPAEWSTPTEPFRIAGNLYYVGTYDLACYFIATPKGHILINTGLAGSAEMIASSIRKLGFKMEDIRILLTTQAHYDHVGAMAEIKKATGAKMMVDRADAGVLADGGASDYALGGHGPTFQPVKADMLLDDGEKITLGGTQLKVLHHPGHTKGSCSFLVNVKDGKRLYRVLIANMPSVVTDKSFNEIAEYPAIAEDYQYTLAAMKTLSFELWLSSHASQFGLHQKRKQGDGYRPLAFSDRAGYDAALSDLEKVVSKKLAPDQGKTGKLK